MQRLATLAAIGVAAIAGCASGGATHVYRVPSQSMAPTLKVGQRVTYASSGAPRRGDIIVFHPPAGADTESGGIECGVQQPANEVCPQPTPQRSNSLFIKRIVAVSGDTLQIRNNRVILNGVAQSEPYINPDSSCADTPSICTLTRPYKLPPGYVFTLGDNRAESADSRLWGPVPIAWIVGRVTKIP